jgi:hypothetical protein
VAKRSSGENDFSTGLKTGENLQENVIDLNTVVCLVQHLPMLD